MAARRERMPRLTADRWQDLPRTEPPPSRKPDLGSIVGTLDAESAREILLAVEEAFERVEAEP